MLDVLAALLKCLVVGVIVYIASLQYLSGGAAAYEWEKNMALKAASGAAIFSLALHKWRDKEKKTEGEPPQEPPDQQKS